MNALERIEEIKDVSRYQGDIHKSRNTLIEDREFLLRAFEVMREMAVIETDYGISTEMNSGFVDKEFEKRMAEGK